MNSNESMAFFVARAIIEMTPAEYGEFTEALAGTSSDGIKKLLRIADAVRSPEH